MRRPTDVLTCYRARRRLGAYLDGALDAGDARWTEDHLAACVACQGEAGQLRRVKALVVEVSAVPGPDWTGFWPGIVRGIEEERHRGPARPRQAWQPWPPWPRWALGGAAVAAIALSLIVWQDARGPVLAEAGVQVSAANTEQPGATVMVYTPDRDTAVVWVFD